MRLSWIATVVLLGSCGHPAGTGTTPPVVHAGSGAGSGSAAGSGHGSGSATRPPDAPVTGGLPAAGVACAPLGCVYHAGANAYFACMSSGAGACFHFGARCAPADACMYDAAAKRYQHCDAVVEGACTKWGIACTPGGHCMFDPADGLHHECSAVKDGACTAWGALCAPR